MRVEEAYGDQVRRYAVAGITSRAYDKLISRLEELIQKEESPVAGQIGRWLGGDRAALAITVKPGCTVEQVDQAIYDALGL
ncbi:MAG TPA: hypothetical protein VJ841_05215 [Candidatus Saccharimonadales bacterium]|nr:hypothetical protein [Candidatus Saccharimonadales bacterium]